MTQQHSDILGIIPARGGSKRLPGKNLALLNGKPLLAYTCEAALGSTRLTRTILSTDDEAIADAGRSCGVEVPFLRPAALATDDADSIDVVRHVLEELKKNEGYVPQLVVLLQPTSPLRTAQHIDDAITLLEEHNADSVVSVHEVPYLCHPSLTMKIKNGELALKELKKPDPTDTYYALNGAVYVWKTELLDNPYGTHCRPLVMTNEESIDIDTHTDLVVAEGILRTRT